METRRWTNPSQPQTLQIAVFLLYANAVIAVLYGYFFSLLGLAFIIGYIASGLGIASERKWGYGLAILMALAFPALRVASDGLSGLWSGNPINLLFEIALVALLLHPQSRDYERIWFS